ncbi:MAG: acyl-CoA dehydrogenase family protein [Actinomycetota bacterium]|nr:acyl-CoA dehydrogenase family protein [Actinomycetota bacterium]
MVDDERRGGASSDVPAGATAFEAMLDLAHPLKVEAAAWAATELPGAGSGIDRDVWRRAATWGVQGLLVPTALGGGARSISEALLVFEGLGLGCVDNGVVFALASQVFAMQRALTSAGSPAQLERWLRPLVAGELIGSFAMSEPDAGSDTASITTTATALDDGGYRLDGVKSWVTLGPICDVVIVFATTDPAKGRWGITAFVLDANSPGLRRGPVVAKMGLGTCPFGTLELDGVVVGPDAVLGAVGAGAAIFADAVESERAYLYAAPLGAMERVIDASIRRARERRQFGAPIGTFQAVSHRIVEMKLRHEAARLLVYKAAALAERGESVAVAAALAKLQTSEMSVVSALDAIRIHGAEGYTEAAGVEAELRDAIGGLAFSGTSDIQRNLVARLLGVDRPARRRARG